MVRLLSFDLDLYHRPSVIPGLPNGTVNGIELRIGLAESTKTFPKRHDDHHPALVSIHPWISGDYF